MNLGKLQRVELRTIWEHEAQDFTPWLANENNLEELANTIGMDLELIGQEQNVGPYRADILCKDAISQSNVLIENQLEKTDHNHLGQILTYAAGLDAKVVVWIASRFTEEHRAAIDWLNSITSEEFGFFALEIELWRIGDSPAAPKFNVVCKPNAWRRVVQDASNLNAELSGLKQTYLRFWTELREYLTQLNSPLRSQSPLPQHWTNYSIGRTGFTIMATISAQYSRLGAELYIDPKNFDPKQVFADFLACKEQIEQACGFELDWQELPDARGSRIAVYRTQVDVTDEAVWPEAFQWFDAHLQTLDKVFRKRIKAL